MKKLLIITSLLTITGLTLEAMQQTGKQVQDKVPKLYTMIINKVIEGSLDKKKLLEELQGQPEFMQEIVQEAIDKAFISSFNQSKPISSNNTLIGRITLFSDNSMRIDNYLGIGDTLYLSGDLQQYLHKDAAGNDIVNSLDKEHIKTEPSSSHSYYKLPQGIESEYYPSKVVNQEYGDKEVGPFLKIRYPQDFEIEFKAQSSIIARAYSLAHSLLSITQASSTISSYPQQSSDNLTLLLSLHRAIANLDGSEVQRIVNLTLDPNNIKKVIDYVFITDNALHRTIKRALTATDQQQLDDAKAIIRMLLIAGAHVNQQNSEGKTALQLAAGNPELLAFIKHAQMINRDLLPLSNAINQLDRKAIEQILAPYQQRGRTRELLNANYIIKYESPYAISINNYTPLVAVLRQALSAKDKKQFKQYIDIAQFFITNGATLSNPSGKQFIAQYGKQYREHLAPHLSIE